MEGRERIGGDGGREGRRREKERGMERGAQLITTAGRNKNDSRGFVFAMERANSPQSSLEELLPEPPYCTHY